MRDDDLLRHKLMAREKIPVLRFSFLQKCNTCGAWDMRKVIFDPLVCEMNAFISSRFYAFHVPFAYLSMLY